MDVTNVKEDISKISDRIQIWNRRNAGKTEEGIPPTMTIHLDNLLAWHTTFKKRKLDSPLLLHGLAKEWYRNGDFCTEAYFIDDFLEGEAILYDRDSKYNNIVRYFVRA
jgi:hypothetical protein